MNKTNKDLREEIKRLRDFIEEVACFSVGTHEAGLIALSRLSKKALQILEEQDD